jgi:hypothetical protein
MFQSLSLFIQEDKFTQLERAEEKKKYGFYKKRSMTSIPELISLAQFRLSLYSIFNITDDLEMANIKTKKVRN